MKKIFTAAILTVMIFLLNVGTVKAAEAVQVCDFGVYTITKKLEETGLNIKFSFSTDAYSKDGFYDYFYLFNKSTINLKSQKRDTSLSGIDRGVVPFNSLLNLNF